MTMHQNFNDALQASLGFAVKQTAHIEAGVYKTRYPELDYSSLVPVDASAGEWSKTVTYYSMDQSGAARFINGNGKDVPVVGTAMAQHETRVETAGIGYSYGFEEINQARMLGINLSSDKADAARRAYEEMVYRIVFNGDADKGFEGLFSYTGVPSETIAADGTGSSKLW